MRTALITGISGQDGAYLTRRLRKDGFRVVGTSRTAGVNLWRLEALGLRQQVELREANLAEEGVAHRLILSVRPDEIYHLAGESSVGGSFEHPHAAIDFSARSALHLLETIREHRMNCRLMIGSSAQVFDHQNGRPITEATPFAPVTPYSAGKAAATMIARAYRESFGLFVTILYFGNHESPLRGGQFVTHKIVEGARAIAEGRSRTLSLGNLEVERDWGYAPEYVEAMLLALRAERPDEFIIGTGRPRRLMDFVELTFRRFGLDWKNHVVKDPALLRPIDPPVWRLDPAKAERVLGWKANFGVEEIIEKMINREL